MNFRLHAQVRQRACPTAMGAQSVDSPFMAVACVRAEEIVVRHMTKAPVAHYRLRSDGA
jgi:hypothetical protein